MDHQQTDDIQNDTISTTRPCLTVNPIVNFNDLNYPNLIHHVKSNIYIGSLQAAFNPALLEWNDIDTVLGVINFTPDMPGQETIKTGHYIPVEDRDDENILSYFPQSSDIIAGCIKRRKKILVYCTTGRSRAATIIMAYLMRRYRLNYKDALLLVLRAFPKACPNNGFQVQLHLWAKLQYKLSTSNYLYKLFIYNCYVNNMLHNRDHLQKLNSWYVELLTEYKSSITFQMSSMLVVDFYKCVQCHHFLFNGTSVHSDGKMIFPLLSVPLLRPSCAHNQHVGLIHCPNCDLPIGRYDWLHPITGEFHFRPYTNSPETVCVPITFVHAIDPAFIVRKTKLKNFLGDRVRSPATKRARIAATVTSPRPSPTPSESSQSEA